jgi:hypothetical protein
MKTNYIDQLCDYAYEELGYIFDSDEFDTVVEAINYNYPDFEGMKKDIKEYVELYREVV